jgi:hypothetical protein
MLSLPADPQGPCTSCPLAFSPDGRQLVSSYKLTTTSESRQYLQGLFPYVHFRNACKNSGEYLHTSGRKLEHVNGTRGIASSVVLDPAGMYSTYIHVLFKTQMYLTNLANPAKFFEMGYIFCTM